MPCYTRIQTVLIDLLNIEKAAAALGIQVQKRTANSYTLRKGNEQVTIERTKEGEKFFVSPYSGSDNWQSEIIQPLVMGYAKEQLKSFAKKSGYTLSAGAVPGEYIFTSYK